jgi:hypothetical protein
MRKQRAERLRFAVESLPPETQRAMLKGIRENRIVTGANTDRRGGMCPMLAADRNAFAVTPLAEIFATAWDHYTGTTFVNVTRRAASARDLTVLQSMLESSLALSDRACAPAPAVAAPLQLNQAELAQTRQALTAAARLEVIRALDATGQPAPAHRAPAAPVDAPPCATVPEAIAAYEDRRRRQATPSAAPPARSVSAPRAARLTGAPGRPPAFKTQSEDERQRARAIIANQASTLRSRAWPRPAAPAPAVERARPVPAATPAPAPAEVRVTPRAEPTRVQELAARSGFAWLPAFSSYDDYERTLQDLGETQRGPGADDGGVRRQDTKQPDRTPVRG